MKSDKNKIMPPPPTLPEKRGVVYLVARFRKNVFHVLSSWKKITIRTN